MLELANASPTRLISHIGNTPIVELTRIIRSDRVRIFAKLEWFNPGGSVKDRAALNMIETAENTGLLRPGMTIIDSTSGNTGIAYSMIGAQRGYPVHLALPENASPERKKTLRAYGAQLTLTDPLKGSDGSIDIVRGIHAAAPERYFYPDQYNNDANWRAHYMGTAEEIYRDLRGEITHLVAGRGTTGTFVGTTRRLKEFDGMIKGVSYAPDSPFHGIEGVKHLPTSRTPGIYDDSLVDQEFEITTEEAQRNVLRLAREEGLFAGVSSGAALATALELARNIDRGTIVAILPDGGDRYLSDSFWEGK